MPFTDMLGEPVLFAEHNWARLVSVSSFIRAAEAWGGAQLDVPRAFLCAVVAALRAVDEANSGLAREDVARGALDAVLGGTSAAYAETLDMLGALRAMRAALDPPKRQWTLPASVAETVIGRPVDPLGELTLSQLCVVAALCLKQSDRAFDGVVVSMQHLRSDAYGTTFDARGTRSVATGVHECEWAPSMLVLITEGAQACFTLAAFQRQSYQGPAGYRYHLREPALHDLLGRQIFTAIGDAATRTTCTTLLAFVSRLGGAISRGVDPACRDW